jgi:hypothetical protein
MDGVDHRFEVLDDLGFDQPGPLGADCRFKLLVELLRGRRPGGRHALCLGELDPVQRGIIEVQHREHFFVGLALANPGQFDIQNPVAVVLQHDEGDIDLLPRHRPERLGRIHAATVALENNGLSIRARHRGAQPHRESRADGPATIREQIVVGRAPSVRR